MKLFINSPVGVQIASESHFMEFSWFPAPGALFHGISEGSDLRYIKVHT